MIINATSAQQSITFIQGALKVLTSLQLTSYQFPEQTCVFDGRSFDYVIVGAGTAGCILANRLVEDNKTTVLLIEAGGDPQLDADIPALLLYLKASDEAWNFMTEDSVASKESHKPTTDDLSLGKTLGGSSSVSYLLYSSGSKHDYNNWATIVNDPIWNWDNVLPYLKKTQRLEDQRLIDTDGEFFGTNGNVGLNLVRSAGTIDSAPYLRAFKEMRNDIVPSVNGNISLGYTNAIFTISDGQRQSTAISYLVPKENHPNLYVLKNALVKRILFNGYKRAVGVVAITCDQRFIVIKAREEVIISAGIVNTPKLLMLSGIGPKEQLCKYKIHVVSDLPVGEGFQDHVGVTVIFNMTKLVVPQRPFNPYKYPSTVIVGYVALNKSADYPDYQSVNFLNFPRYLMSYCTFTYFYNDSICDNTIKTSINSQMMFSVINKQKFKGQGRIVLKSSDYRDKPLIYTNYYSEEEDLEDHARIIQNFVRVEESKSFQELGAQFKDPKLAKCGPYNIDDLEYWKCYVKYMMTSQHQYSSTCSMGAVVDSRLRVYGVKRLRIVDASVMPNPTAGGTLGATMMIAEKAADMIKEDRYNYYERSP